MFMKPLTVTPSLSLSKARSPFYGLRNELRAEYFDPTCFLIFTLETHDLATSQYAIIGHAVLPLFITDANKVPCEDRKLKEYHLHSGMLQVPIYNQFPQDLRPMTYKQFISLEKIPCATLLI